MAAGMGRDDDGDSSDGRVPSNAHQSKRQPLNHNHRHGSSSSNVSQASDHDSSAHPQVPGVPNQPQHRSKPQQKHVVGGGTAVRLHARVPSSKTLYKHHAPSSSTKLSERQASPPPDRGIASSSAAAAAAAAPPPGHRRAISDQKLSRDSSSTNLHLRKNNSHSSLIRRNRPHVEVAKKSKSSSQLKRSSSNPNVTKTHKSTKTQVHFDLGNDAAQEDDQDEDEWVDASNSVSPYLSRRGSIVSSGQSSSRPPTAADQSASNTPPRQGKDADLASGPTDTNRGAAHSPNRGTLKQKDYITSRLLQRTPSQGAPPKMSTETAPARPLSSGPHSPESGLSRESTTSTLSTTPATSGDTRPGSSGKEQLTSRFITKSGQGSGSFYNSTKRGTAAQANGKSDGPKRPRSLGNLTQLNQQPEHYSPSQTRPIANDDPSLTDEEDGYNGGLAANARHRRAGGHGHGHGPDSGHGTPRAEISRTQQKLNLQRASSNIEPTGHPGLGMGIAGVALAAGPLVGGTGYETRDPRLGKLLERTGMEYLVVRRYQNPVARSVARVTQMPGAERNRRIPSRPGTAATVGHGDHHLHRAKRGTENGHRETRSRPVTPARGNGSSRARVNGGGGGGSSLETDDEAVGRLQEALSGSSLVDDEGGNGLEGEDDATLAVLRNLWEKNLDSGLSSQD